MIAEHGAKKEIQEERSYKMCFFKKIFRCLTPRFLSSVGGASSTSVTLLPNIWDLNSIEASDDNFVTLRHCGKLCQFNPKFYFQQRNNSHLQSGIFPNSIDWKKEGNPPPHLPLLPYKSWECIIASNRRERGCQCPITYPSHPAQHNKGKARQEKKLDVMQGPRLHCTPCIPQTGLGIKCYKNNLLRNYGVYLQCKYTICLLAFSFGFFLATL